MDKLIGVLITSITQVNDVVPFSSAVAFMPEDGAELVEYLDEIDNRLVPVIFIDDFFKVDGKYVSGYSHDLYTSLEYSNHFGRIVFAFDEPMWNATKNGQDHDEVLKCMQDIKNNYPGVEMMHTEAYAELYNQYTQNNGKLKLFYDAEHIGFNCYGDFQNCGGSGVPGLNQFIYLNEINKAIIANGSDAKLFLVPMSFTSTGNEADQHEVTKQLQSYYFFMQNNLDRVSGLGGFVWGDCEFCDIDIKGAVNNVLIRDSIEKYFPLLGRKSQDFRIVLDELKE
jgi:hypothetical protein